MSAVVVSIIFISIVITSFISGILGMAGGMIFMGVLMALLPITQAMILHGVVQMASNGWRAWLWRAYIVWPITRNYIIGAISALLVFMLVRIIVSKPIGFMILGATPFITLLLPQRATLTVDKPLHAMACGFVSTGLQLTAGVSGPILDSFFVRASLNKHDVVATKAITQTFGHLLKIAYFGGFASIFMSSTPQTSASYIAPWILLSAVALAFLGTTLSRRILDSLDESKFRSYTRSVIMLIGTGYLITGFWLFFNL